MGTERGDAKLGLSGYAAARAVPRPAPHLAQTRRSTATTFPRIVAVSPGIGV